MADFYPSCSENLQNFWIDSNHHSLFRLLSYLLPLLFFEIMFDFRACDRTRVVWHYHFCKVHFWSPLHLLRIFSSLLSRLHLQYSLLRHLLCSILDLSPNFFYVLISIIPILIYFELSRLLVEKFQLKPTNILLIYKIWSFSIEI